MPAPLRSATVVLATQVLLFAASPVLDEPVRCQRSIAKESSKFIQPKMKALGKCEDGKVLGRVAANSDCHADSMTASVRSRGRATRSATRAISGRSAARSATRVRCAPEKERRYRRGRKRGRVTSSFTLSKTTSTGIPIESSSFGQSRMVECRRMPSSSSMIATL